MYTPDENLAHRYLPPSSLSTEARDLDTSVGTAAISCDNIPRKKDNVSIEKPIQGRPVRAFVIKIIMH